MFHHSPANQTFPGHELANLTQIHGSESTGSSRASSSGALKAPSQCFFFCFVFFTFLVRENTFQTFWVSLKLKGVKDTVLLEVFLFTKSLSSQFFGQKQVFFVKSPNVLMPITEEWKRVFFLTKEESTLLSFD